MISVSCRAGGGAWGGEHPLGARPQPSCSLPLPLTQARTYTGAQAVGRGDLVDVIGVDVVIGAAGSGLALAPPRGPGVHHAAGRGACLRLLPARERVAVVRHNPGGAGGVSWPSPGPLPHAPSLPARPAAHPRRRRNHQAPSRCPPRQPCWLCLSQDSRFWGDRTGVMCPREWIETRSDATAGEGAEGPSEAQAWV